MGKPSRKYLNQEMKVTASPPPVIRPTTMHPLIQRTKSTSSLDVLPKNP